MHRALHRKNADELSLNVGRTLGVVDSRHLVRGSEPKFLLEVNLNMDAPNETPNPDQLLASAAKFLIEKGDNEAASVLLDCRVEHLGCSKPQAGPASLGVYLRGPNAAYEVLSIHDAWYDENGNWVYPVSDRVQWAFEAIMPHGFRLGRVDVRAEMVEIGTEWRTELTGLARGNNVHNQTNDSQAERIYNGLRFRSASEVLIAEALDRAGVMYFPLCKGRMNSGRNRVNREPDFLICHRGKWGILEVDGEPYHPPSRTVEDHTRDRLFKGHGVVVVEHFDAKHCYDFPDEVVKRCLGLLDNTRGV